MLFCGNHFSGFLCGFDNQLFIQGFDGMDVDNFGIDAVFCKLFSRFQRCGYADACCYDGNIRPFPKENAFSDFDL